MMGKQPKNVRAQASKKKQKKKNNKGPKAMARPRFALSDCSTLYLQALTNPFGIFPTAPCVPDLYDTPSKKISILQRGTFVVPANNVGFVSARVYDMLINNVFTVFESTGSYADPGIPTSSATLGMLQTVSVQGPYIATKVGSSSTSIQYRLVGAGLRCRYIGTELNRGGLVVPFRHPQNQDSSGYSLQACQSFRTTRLEPASRGWHGICWQPVRAAEYQYFSGAVASGNPGAQGNIHILVAPSGAQMTWQYEIVAHFEVTGDTDSTTRSESDTVGLSAIRSILEGGLDGDPGTSLYQEAKQLISKLGPHEISGFVSGVAKTGLNLYMGSV